MSNIDTIILDGVEYQATVHDGGISTEKLQNGCVTKEKLSSDIAFGDNGLPILYLTGSLEGISKDDKVNLLYLYVDENKSKEFTGWCTLKWQGQTSLNWNKHNFKIVFYKDPYYRNKDKIDMGFGKQSKYTLKSNYNDYSMARNVVSAELWGDIVKTRRSYPQGLASTPNHGAVDGFPFLIYLNGEFYGLYDFNVDKEWMTDLDEDNPSHALVSGALQGEDVRFISVGTLSSWEIEIPDVMNADIRTALTNLVGFVVNSTDEEFASDLDQYIDVESVIDYICFTWFIGATDNLGKNIYLITYDNTKWYMSAYDLDATFGNVWNGGLVVPYNTPFPDGSGDSTDYQVTDNRLFIRMLDLYADQIVDRYRALRKTVLSIKYITDKFHRFMGKIDDRSRFLDREKWGTKAYSESGALSEEFIINWITQRSRYVDSHVSALLDDFIPCEGVSLNVSTLYFETSAPITLIATLTPVDASDDVIWESSNTSVCIVSQSGEVTPVNSGTATVTVMCGEYYATCEVTVSEDIVIWSNTKGYRGSADGTWTFDLTQFNHDRYMTTKDVNLKHGHNYTFTYGAHFADMIVYDQNNNPIDAVADSRVNGTIRFGAMNTLTNVIPTKMKLFAQDISVINLSDTVEEWSRTAVYFNTQNGKIMTKWEKDHGVEVDITGYQEFLSYVKFDMIEVSAGEVYTITGGREPFASFYDTNGRYLSYQRTAGVSTIDVTVPTNAKYMRLLVNALSGTADPNTETSWEKNN